MVQESRTDTRQLYNIIPEFMGNERRKDPNYKKGSEAPQAHVNGSNNRPASVAELKSKLAGLRQQVAEAISRTDTGRPTSGHSQKGLRRGIRDVKAELGRRWVDWRQKESSQSPQVGHGVAATVKPDIGVGQGSTWSFTSGRPDGRNLTTSIARSSRMEAQQEAPRTLNRERDLDVVTAFLQRFDSEGIRTVYIDGIPVTVDNVYPLSRSLYYLTAGSIMSRALYEDDWRTRVVSLDPPSTTDTSERKNSLQRGASEDECEEFFGQLEGGDAVIAIDGHGRETPFRFSFVAYDTSSPAVYGRDARNVTQVFYTATSGFMIEKKRVAASGRGDW